VNRHSPTLKYGIGEGDVGCWRFRREFLCGAFYGLPWEVYSRSNFSCKAIVLHEGLLKLGSYDTTVSKEEFSSLLTILRVNDVSFFLLQGDFK